MKITDKDVQKYRALQRFCEAMKELDEVFESADELLDCYYPPDFWDFSDMHVCVENWRNGIDELIHENLVHDLAELDYENNYQGRGDKDSVIALLKDKELSPDYEHQTTEEILLQAYDSGLLPRAEEMK